MEGNYGVWNESSRYIKDDIFMHYKLIFEEPNIERPSLEDLNYPSLSSDNALELEAPFDEKEIRGAIFNCGSTKTLGPDGFNMRFFKKYWKVIRIELIETIKWFWEKYEFSRRCNASLVTLIPKKFDPLGLGDFHPISLFRSYHKIVAKILSNRLRRIIPSIVAAVGLNILAKAATEKGFFKGVEVGDDKVLISHLQYADDAIFLGEWSRSNAYSLQNILKCFELASGLKVKFQKSCLYGIDVSHEKVTTVASRIGCQVGSFPFTYLRLPIGVKMKKLNYWNQVIDKIKVKLSDWKMRMLSFGGRLVLIKSILNSLPLYYFSLFRAPAALSLNQLVMELQRLSGLSYGSEETNYGFMFPRLYRFKVKEDALVKDRIDVAAVIFVRWSLAHDGIFIVKRLTSAIDEQANSGKRLTSIIDEQANSGNNSALETMKNIVVPKKLQIFVRCAETFAR
ncbi:uncharacterized protein [Rutidosis leptorrhynchoides]|uniref:uncharacterized protein n=1 Tax=Rutidosis leptorrhynchoides TaxID=125765 RepID=UPI003A9A4C7F